MYIWCQQNRWSDMRKCCPRVDMLILHVKEAHKHKGPPLRDSFLHYENK